MDAAKALYDRRLAAIMKNGDANNTLYEIELIYDYSPEADLPKIKAHVLLINNVEDFADPPTLGTVERAMKKITHGTYVLTPLQQSHTRPFYALLRGGVEAVSGEVHGRTPRQRRRPHHDRNLGVSAARTAVSVVGPAVTRR